MLTNTATIRSVMKEKGYTPGTADYTSKYLSQSLKGFGKALLGGVLTEGEVDMGVGRPGEMSAEEMAFRAALGPIGIASLEWEASLKALGFVLDGTGKWIQSLTSGMGTGTGATPGININIPQNTLMAMTPEDYFALMVRAMDNQYGLYGQQGPTPRVGIGRSSVDSEYDPAYLRAIGKDPP